MPQPPNEKNAEKNAEKNSLAQQFETHRSHLRGVAYRMLGSLAEAEDAVQEAWLRLSRAEPDQSQDQDPEKEQIANLGGWLTTVVARICLDLLRSRRSRGEEPASAEPAQRERSADPESEALLADSVGEALLVVLQTLQPMERVAFVLHDLFEVPFEEIAPIVGRSLVATRQLASRARARVRGAEAVAGAELASQRKVVDAFLAASRGGDLNGLLAVLAPDVVFRTDAAAARLDGTSEVRGAAAVASRFLGRAQAARPMLINGALGLFVAPGGRLLLTLELELVDGKLVGITALADPEHLANLELEELSD